MSDKGTPHNIGQAFFESLGKGLSALPGILEQERQKQMQNLQLQMEQERHAINVEQGQIGLEKSRAGMSEFIRRAGMSLEEKAEEDRGIQAENIRFAFEQLNPLSGMPIGLGGFPEDAGLGQLQGILGAQGIDTSFSIGGVDFAQREEDIPFNPLDFLPTDFVEDKFVLDPKTGKTTITYKREIIEQVDSETLIQNAQEEADKRGLVIDRVNLDENGRIKSISLKQPTAEGVETDANRRARFKEEDRRARDTILSEANDIFEGVPQGIREKAKVGVITNIADLKKVLIQKEVTGVKKTFGIDWLDADIPELVEIHRKLTELANKYSAIGGTAKASTVDEIMDIFETE